MTTLTKPFPTVKRITLTVSNQLQKIDVPLSTGKASVQFITNPGKIAFVGTNGSPIGADYATITNDAWFEINWGADPDKYNAAKKTDFYLAAAIVPTVVEILAED